MKLINNEFHGIQGIDGFTKEEIVEVKRILTGFSKENAEEEVVTEYLEKNFPLEVFTDYEQYLSEISGFISDYLSSKKGVTITHHYGFSALKGGIKAEIDRITKNVVNLRLNAQNSLRFLKGNTFLKNLVEHAGKILENGTEVVSKLHSEEIYEEKENFQNELYLWKESNKIKNLTYNFKYLPDDLLKWEDYSNLYDFLLEKNDISEKKARKKRGSMIFPCKFQQLDAKIIRNKGDQKDFFWDLIYFLFLNSFTDEDKEEFVNIMERKEIKQKLKEFFRPIIKDIINHNFEKVIVELKDLSKNYSLFESGKSLDIEKLSQEKINVYFPQLVKSYLNGLEKRLDEKIEQSSKDTDFKQFGMEYKKKIEKLTSLLENTLTEILELNQFLIPYEDITQNLQRTFENVEDEIIRRGEDYGNYLTTIKQERVRAEVRGFIEGKIDEINKIIAKYQESASNIVKDELPQLNEAKNIIKEYKTQIESLKKVVANRLEQYKDEEVDIYQIIKRWEDNFASKQDQLGFLFSLVINKLYKKFRELIESERSLFDGIFELSRDEEDEEDRLPLNYALSEFLIDKLTENELNERITQIKSKVKGLKQEINLYEGELGKLEDTLVKKIKIREGITSENVQCSVCRKKINFADDQIIVCPFCQNAYHYLCIAFWLSKHNSCPVCQNQFLDPGSGIYE